MKAWLLPKLGSIDALNLTDVPAPVAGDGEVVLKLDYAALNPADRYLAEGMYPARPAMPHILGRDGLGTVETVGPGVTNWKPGDRAVLVRSEVGVNRLGTFAERVAVPAESLTSVPSGWTDEQAAGAVLVYLTAWQALTQWEPLPAGAVVLVSGASGGVGVATIQLARALGAVPVGLSRGPSKVDALKRLGADLVLDPTDPAWPKKLKAHLGERRVHLVVDNIAGEGFNDLLRTLGDNGRMSLVGRLAGPVPQLNTADLFFRRIRLGGVSVGAYKPDESAAAWAEVVKALDTAGSRPQIDRVFDFADLPAAFARLAEGPLGKVLLRI